MEGSDVLYFPISFSERKIFGIIDENATGLTAENTYKITADDLGNVMGIVGDSEDERTVSYTHLDVYKRQALKIRCLA